MVDYFDNYLFLFSESDNLINFEAVEEFMKKLERKGVKKENIKYKKWKDSEHVKHYLNHK